MSNEILVYKKEIERLNQDITLAKDLNTPFVELPIVENKHKEPNFLNNMHDDDEMVSIVLR